jgi:hypothetical protein
MEAKLEKLAMIDVYVVLYKEKDLEMFALTSKSWS